MTLRWDAATYRFLGERIAVSLQAYDAMIEALMAAGMGIIEAYQWSLEEGRWNTGTEGVEVLAEPWLCLHCRQPLPLRRGKFCDVRCEAESYTEAHS